MLDGRDDEAASDLISRLLSEQWRTDALESMQTYAAIRRLPLESVLEDKWRRIHARPDVRDADREVGRVESFRIDPSPS